MAGILKRLLKRILIEGANAIIVVAALIYPLTWVSNMVFGDQQEVDFDLYIRYVLLAFFGKLLGRMWIVFQSRRSRKKKI